MDLAVRCRGLVKRYDAKTLAVDDLDLDLRTGECLGLLGPNGAGKTTTMEILEGLTEPTGGEVEVLGMRWAKQPRALRERIGVSLQETQLPERLSAEEIVRLFRAFYPRGRSVEESLAMVGLTEKRKTYFGKLSGGQKQRLAVACATVGDPDLLFLDEPTTGLDPQSRLQLWDIVQRYKDGGRSVLLTTHAMEEAERLCDRVAVVDRGKVIAEGTPGSLIASLGANDVVEVAFAQGPGALDDAALAALPHVHAVRRAGGGVVLSCAQVHVVIPALLDAMRASGGALERLTTRHATLEDVFVALTGRHLRD